MEIPEKPKKILVIRSGAIGDVLMTTPFLKSIRKKFPDSRITYLTGNWSKQALRNNPDIDELVSFEDEIIFKKKFFRLNRLRKKLKKQKFDLCLVLDKSYLFNLFAYFCRIPYRIGFDRKGEGFANTKSVYYDGTKYELDYYLDLARLVGAKVKDKKIQISPTEKDKKKAKRLSSKLKGGNVVGIAPGGAENPGQKVHQKRWPKKSYIELIKKLLKKKKTKVILFGGERDKKLNEEIIKKVKSKRILNFAGKLNIQQSYLLMKKCNLFITHDSGALHIAAASGIPLIALFGPTPSERFAPKDSTVIKSKSKHCPCYDIYGNLNCKVDCMSLIEVEQVLKKAKELLK